MDLKKTTAPVNTITYNKSEIEAPTGNIYEAITIIAKRASQINTEIKKELIEKLDEFFVRIEDVMTFVSDRSFCKGPGSKKHGRT